MADGGDLEEKAGSFIERVAGVLKKISLKPIEISKEEFERMQKRAEWEKDSRKSKTIVGEYLGPGPVGAIGFGLNEQQQRAIADLWYWGEQSLKSKIILGRPVKEYNAFA